jgi:predicted flavoprotein YhiN
VSIHSRITPSRSSPHRVAVIGGGPAGLMAAEILTRGGARVDLYDRMPSLGRKFLLAGRGGLNLTHSEPRGSFLSRYGERRKELEPLLDAFGPDDLRAWAHDLGVETFVGSSGRVFPREMKAAPLLRAWLHRLRQAGARFHVGHRWLGWEGEAPASSTHRPACSGTRRVPPCWRSAVASWQRLGSDGAWVPLLHARGVDLAPLRPSNCGFDVAWSEHLTSRHAGAPLKSVAISVDDATGDGDARAPVGEFVLTETGVEGSLIYAASSRLRDTIEATGRRADPPGPGAGVGFAAPDGGNRPAEGFPLHVQPPAKPARPQGGENRLLRERLPAGDFADATRLAAAIKALPLRLIAARPLEEAISSAGGVSFPALDERLMVRAVPGVFCAGEMLDWEAPTGGYLLTACFASGRAAGAGVLAWLAGRD